MGFRQRVDVGTTLTSETAILTSREENSWQRQMHLSTQSVYGSADCFLTLDFHSLALLLYMKITKAARSYLVSRNYYGHDRVKHLDLRDMLVREHHQRGLTELVSVPTQFQLADPLTKTLAGPAVRNFRAWSLRGQLPPDCPTT